MPSDGGARGIDAMLAVAKAPWYYAYNQESIRLQNEDTLIMSPEVNEAAGLTWNVYQTPAYVFVGEDPGLDTAGNVVFHAGGKFKLVGTQRKQGDVPVPDYYLNVRDDIDRVIGIVKKRYRILQNTQAPLFLDNLVDSGDGCYETAGSLHGGSQVWWLMRLPEGVNVAGDPREKLETYLLLTNSHDGSTSIVVAVVTIRVVCQNTLAWSLKRAIRTMKVRHTDSAKEQLMQARKTLELGLAYQAALAEVGDRLANTSFTEGDLARFLDSLLPTPEPVIKDDRVRNQRGITMARNTKRAITDVYRNSETQTHIQGTLWGAVQACQFYSDHLSISRNTDDSSADENRFKRLTSGQNLGSEAFAKALTLIT